METILLLVAALAFGASVPADKVDYQAASNLQPVLSDSGKPVTAEAGKPALKTNSGNNVFIYD